MAAVLRFFNKAIESNSDPDKIAMDKSGANKAAIGTINAGRDVPILVREVKYLNSKRSGNHACGSSRILPGERIKST